MSEAFEQLLAARPGLALPGAGQGWIDALRDKNARRFGEIGLPTLRDEDWKYTNIKPIVKRDFAPARRGTAVTEQDLDVFRISELDASRVVLVNGHYSQDLSHTGGLPKGVRITSLARGIAEQPSLLEPWLGHLTTDAENGFQALNSAFLQDGVMVWVPEGCRIGRPIELCCVQYDDAEDIVSQPRNLIVAGEGSQFTIIERYLSLNGQHYLTNAITEVFAQKNVKLEHYRLQQESDLGYHVGSWLIDQREGSRVNTHNVAFGGAIARTELHVRLNGVGACCALNGVYVLKGRQHVDNHTRVDHLVADTTSKEFYKGVLDGRSRAVFHGRIKVHPDAQRSDAQQQNRNLLLSADAEVDTKPQLEIYTDDVACSHGATVGQLDADALYYLRTRGVDEQTSRSLLTYAFANDLIENFELPQLRSYVEHELTSKMFSVDDVEEIL